ncbi:MAG: hypothetical protein SPI25_02520 [Dialister sp.]|nr:hypothetical protein [Dialister sp.]
MKKLIAALLIAAAPLVASAQVTDAVTCDGFGLNLVYPAVHSQNVAAEDAINKDIKTHVRDLVSLYQDGTKKEVYMLYDRHYEDAKMVSFVMESVVMKPNMANAETHVWGATYDKRNGDLLPLSRFTKPISDVMVIKGLKEGTLSLYDLDGKKLKYDPFFKPVKTERSFFLLGKNKLGLLYQQGELAPYSDGATYVAVDL